MFSFKMLKYLLHQNKASDKKQTSKHTIKCFGGSFKISDRARFSRRNTNFTQIVTNYEYNKRNTLI